MSACLRLDDDPSQRRYSPVSIEDWVAHDVEWFAENGSWPLIMSASPRRFEARGRAVAIIRGLMRLAPEQLADALAKPIECSDRRPHLLPEGATNG